MVRFLFDFCSTNHLRRYTIIAQGSQHQAVTTSVSNSAMWDTSVVAASTSCSLQAVHWDPVGWASTFPQPSNHWILGQLRFITSGYLVALALSPTRRLTQGWGPQTPGICKTRQTSFYYNPHHFSRPVKPGTNFSFELIREQGAALITKCSTFRGDTELETAFEDYTKRHYNSWVTFARNKRCGNDVKPILVSGVDITKDFATMAYSNNGAGRSCKFDVSGPITGSSSESVWGIWKTQGVVHTNCGPRRSQRETLESELPDIDARGIPENYDQCVFVRYYTMRFREPAFPKLAKTGAGPRGLSPGGNRDKGKATTWLSLDSNTEVDEVGGPALLYPGSVASNDPGLGGFRNVPSVRRLSPSLPVLTSPPRREKTFLTSSQNMSSMWVLLPSATSPRRLFGTYPDRTLKRKPR